MLKIDIPCWVHIHLQWSWGTPHTHHKQASKEWGTLKNKVDLAKQSNMLELLKIILYLCISKIEMLIQICRQYRIHLNTFLKMAAVTEYILDNADKDMFSFVFLPQQSSVESKPTERGLQLSFPHLRSPDIIKNEPYQEIIKKKQLIVKSL